MVVSGVSCLGGGGRACLGARGERVCVRMSVKPPVSGGVRVSEARVCESVEVGVCLNSVVGVGRPPVLNTSCCSLVEQGFPSRVATALRLGPGLAAAGAVPSLAVS